MPRLCFKRLDSSAGSVSSNGLASRKRQKIETLPESKTVTTFASMIGRGRCSIDAAAELARDIVHDHDVAPHPAIKSFASLGNEGQSRSNQERDLHRWMKNRWGFSLQGYTISLDLQVDGKRKAPRSVPVKVLLPHEVMHALAHSNEFAFNTLILGNTDSETRSAFWEHVSKQKPWSNQPCIHAAHASCTLDKLVGCSIHGDGAQMYREDEFFCWSWSSIFASMSGICKDVLLIKYPIAVIPERQMRSQEVRDAAHAKIAELVTWSLRIASNGVGPDVGFRGEAFKEGTQRWNLRGKELSKGFKLCFFCFKADLKARKQMHVFERYYQCNLFCDRCMALQGPNCPEHMDYRNIGPSAAWPLTEIDDAFYRTLDAHSLSPWLQMDGFNLGCIAYDWMHNVFLGTARDLVASGIFVLISSGRFGPPTDDMDEILCRVQRSIHRTCAANGMRLPSKPHLTVANLRADEGYAEMGTRFKASHIRLLVRWLARETQIFADANQNDCVVNVLAACAYNLQRACELVEHGSLLLFSEEDSVEASSCIRAHLKAFWWLAYYFFQRRELLFKLRCKSHYLFHTADDIERYRINPAVMHCFGEESFLGKVKSILVSCHGATCTHSFFMRYLLAVSVSLKELKEKENQFE